MEMDHRIMYTFRGWIAFIAFMDLGVAFRSFIENKCIIGEQSFAKIEQITDQDDLSLPRVVGMYSILKSTLLIHCTLFIHCPPVVSMAICTIIITIIMYLMESLYYQSAVLNFYIIFPCVLNAITVLGLLILPPRVQKGPTEIEEENAELLKQAAALRKNRKPAKKIN